ncbi:MAG: serine hydrolase domain-containing protein [Vulcanimicrobiota bacterium]
MKKTAALFLTVILVIALSSCSSSVNDTGNQSSYLQDTATDYSSAIEQTTMVIEKAMQDSHVVGLSIALVDGQNTIWQQGFGYADKAGGVATSTDTIFQIGSISKPLAATAVMQLVEQGKLDLDRPVVDYIPEFSIQSRISGADSSKITTRMLLTHHAGLPYDGYTMTSYDFRPQEAYDVTSLLRKDWLCFAPNTTYAYSNLGATLITTLVERASGQDFITYTDANLFAPMGMPMTSYSPKSQMKQYMSKDYDSTGEETPYVYVNFMPAGSALSNAADMAGFIKIMLAGGRCGLNTVIKPSSLKEMWTRQNEGVALDFDFQIGLYWILSDPEMAYAGKVVGFSGDSAHQHSRLIILPDQQLGVIVMSNSALGSSVVRTVAVSALENALKAKSGIEPPAAQAQSPTVSLPQETLAGYTGLYTGAAGGVVTLSVEGGHLLASSVSGTSYTLLPLANGNFVISGLPGQENHEYVFENVGGWQVLSDIWLGVKLLPLLTKVSVSAPSQAWKDRAGSWVVDVPSGFYPYYKTLDLSEQNGVLVMTINKAACFALNTVSDNEAVNLGLGTYRGDTVRAEVNNGTELLYYDDYMFRRASAAALKQKASSRGK